MRQGAFCTKVGTLPGTDYRVQPHYMDMLDLAEAWRFGRGGGVKVAVIDTGVSAHPRLTDLVGGGDYVLAGGDGLSDCDAHGTIVASLIAAQPADGKTPLPAAAPSPPPGHGSDDRGPTPTPAAADGDRAGAAPAPAAPSSGRGELAATTGPRCASRARRQPRRSPGGAAAKSR